MSSPSSISRRRLALRARGMSRPIQARGSERTLDRLARKFGLQLSDGRFVPPTQRHVLFFGHIGSGKTTELRRYAKALTGPDRFFVVEVDISTELDRNNLQYADTLMALARVLFDRLEAAGVVLDASALDPLERWFSERKFEVQVQARGR